MTPQPLRPRRTLFFGLAIGVASALIALMAATIASGGWTGLGIAILVCFAGTSLWTGICAAHAMIGFAILILHRDPVGAVFPASPIPSDPLPLKLLPPVAIAVTIRNEDMAKVLPPLRRLLDDLDSSGQGAAFTLFVLSDTQDAIAASREAAAVARFRAADPRPARVCYRRRADNAGFKAGNVMEFLDNHAGDCDLMLLLDADSAMSAQAVLRLAQAMIAEPGLGIVQHLTVGAPARAAFPRLFQFGMRAGMRVWATGQAWWQGDEGPYWGHNAMIRVSAFRTHGRLPLLPNGQTILSHDQVEAVRLRAAGWGIRLLPDEDGCQEENPPALPEFLLRELRWMEGNLQYRSLMALPGLRPLGRWQLAQAMLMFFGAPLYLLIFELGALAAALGERVDAGWALATVLASMLALHSPKLLGYVQVSLSPKLRARYGGAFRFVCGVMSELVFSLLLDPISLFSKTLAMARLGLGAGQGWTPQNRADRRVTWRESTRLLWPHTLFGALMLSGYAAGSWVAALWALPLAGGLLIAVPFCVLASSERVSRILQQRGIAAIPEELRDPAPILSRPLEPAALRRA